MIINPRLKNYFYLIRLHKPIGIFLLLWPTLWALWLASAGRPPPLVVSVFVLGVILMRSAGCALNDSVDYKFDKKVKRTQTRPVAAGVVSPKTAFLIFGLLSSCAFLLVLLLNSFTIFLAIGGGLLTLLYPFLKRVTHLPQLGLGLAFSWGIPMAFAALDNSIPPQAWGLFLAAGCWPLIYDTFYAMADRDDDIKIGVKSTAILLGKFDKFAIGVLQGIFLLLMIVVGYLFHLKRYYYFSLLVASGFFIYQYFLVKKDVSLQCIKAFENNNWVGFTIFLGVAASSYL